MAAYGLPPRDGLYDPEMERDACGVGFVANIDGHHSHDIIEKGIQILINLTHRGAAGSDPETGDGAGLLVQIPDDFFRKVCPENDIELPPEGAYGVGMMFMPRDKTAADECKKILQSEFERCGCKLLGWRDVPFNEDAVGWLARQSCPHIEQVFLTAPDDMAPQTFERLLYLMRRRAENEIIASRTEGMDQFYAVSLSCRTVCYKGLMLAHQVPTFYPDLAAEEFKSAIAVVHQRYSTNTFPTWPLAQPFRYMAHNGEINTLRGNINNMKARSANLQSEIFGDELKDLFPIIQEGGSDSACFDNALELIHLAGRNLPHAMMMMVPEAWGVKYYMGQDRRSFYEYHSMVMEPWDGPAALVATDGIRVCATLDRNGLRPSRYVITKAGQIIMGSEIGVLEVAPQDALEKGRLSPGKILLVDTERKRVLHDEEVKAEVCRQAPYRRWVAANRIELRGLFDGTAPLKPDRESLFERQVTFGYTREDKETIIAPMAAEGKEPIGSMGDDTPLAVLSDKPQLLFNYFKQLFAQVTNLAIDPIREELVMSLTTYLGAHHNLLTETPEHARMLKLRTPILTNDDLNRVRTLGEKEFKSVTLDMTFPAAEGAEGMEKALEQLCISAYEAVRSGCTAVILSDRNIDSLNAPIPSLLAVAAVNHHLVFKGIRTQANVILESGEPREVEHFALLLGYGASAINPYVAMETIAVMIEDGTMPRQMSVQDGLEHYATAIEKGLLKIFSKMGISTLRSYRGAQIFEALGLSEDLVNKYFTNTRSRIGGLGIEEVAREVLIRHDQAYSKRPIGPKVLESGGRFSVRRDGERHLWTPDSIRYLQQSTRKNDRELYRKFAETINNQENHHCTLRSLFDFKPDKSISIDEVEPVEEIMARFITGAMSFGSISREAHEAMAIAMNRLGGRSNSGEGGEDPERFKPLPNGDNRCSATKQVASGRFGVTAEYLANATEIQIKVAQGAKPGEGGHLPGHKVNVEIAGVRHSTPGVSLISPPPHHDIYSIEDLAQLIFDLKNANPAARINVKLVSEVGVGTVAAGVSKGHADALLISGGDGGTGASPISSIKYAGIPWELGLSETHQVLVKNDLRGRIRVQTDGQMRTGRDIVIASLLGAEEYGFATAALVVLGCVMMRKCQKNTCPVGVATQDPRLRKRFSGHPDYLINYFRFVAEDVREMMANMGFRTMDEMIGRADRLKMRDNVTHWKARTLNLDAILHRPAEADKHAVRQVQEQDHGLDNILDCKLIEICKPAIEKGEKVEAEFPIRNVDRTTGTMLSGIIAKKYGHTGLPDDTISFTFTGSAGQSFGAFSAHGLTLQLVGDSNDYVGKGISGAKIIVRKPEEADFDAHKNVIIGNVALYGAVSGEAYINGLAGERFAIRNSGARAVVEGVGDHGCEYMTGGVVVVLGRTGVNFAAGMSGGIAYVYDPHQDFDLRCNLDMVDLEPMTSSEDIDTLRNMLKDHIKYTGSVRARELLDEWDESLSLFVKVIPMEYRRALGQMAKADIGSRRTEAEIVTQG